MMIRIFVFPALQKMFNKDFFFFKLFTTSRTNIHYNYLILIMAAVVGFEPTQHTGSKPAALPTRLHRYIYKTHFFVCSLVFKCVSIFFTKIHNKLNNFWCSIRYLNRVCLDMCNSESFFLYCVFKIYHK